MNKQRAKFLTDVYERHFKETISYEEALKVARDSASVLNDLHFSDPALGYFTRTTKSYFELAEAISVLNDLDKRDHLKAVKCIVSYDEGRVTKEQVIWINQCVSGPGTLRAARLTYLDKLADEKVSGQLYRDLEIVLDS